MFQFIVSTDFASEHAFDKSPLEYSKSASNLIWQKGSKIKCNSVQTITVITTIQKPHLLIEVDWPTKPTAGDLRCRQYDFVRLSCIMTCERSVGDWMIGRKGGSARSIFHTTTLSQKCAHLTEGASSPLILLSHPTLPYPTPLHATSSASQSSMHDVNDFSFPVYETDSFKFDHFWSLSRSGNQ